MDYAAKVYNGYKYEVEVTEEDVIVGFGGGLVGGLGAGLGGAGLGAGAFGAVVAPPPASDLSLVDPILLSSDKMERQIREELERHIIATQPERDAMPDIDLADMSGDNFVDTIPWPGQKVEDPPVLRDIFAKTGYNIDRFDSELTGPIMGPGLHDDAFIVGKLKLDQKRTAEEPFENIPLEINEHKFFDGRLQSFESALRAGQAGQLPASAHVGFEAPFEEEDIAAFDQEQVRKGFRDYDATYRANYLSENLRPEVKPVARPAPGKMTNWYRKGPVGRGPKPPPPPPKAPLRPDVADRIAADYAWLLSEDGPTPVQDKGDTEIGRMTMSGGLNSAKAGDAGARSATIDAVAPSSYKSTFIGRSSADNTPGPSGYNSGTALHITPANVPQLAENYTTSPLTYTFGAEGRRITIGAAASGANANTASNNVKANLSGPQLPAPHARDNAGTGVSSRRDSLSGPPRPLSHGNLGYSPPSLGPVSSGVSDGRTTLGGPRLNPYATHGYARPPIGSASQSSVGSIARPPVGSVNQPSAGPVVRPPVVSASQPSLGTFSVPRSYPSPTANSSSFQPNMNARSSVRSVGPVSAMYPNPSPNPYSSAVQPSMSGRSLVGPTGTTRTSPGPAPYSSTVQPSMNAMSGLQYRGLAHPHSFTPQVVIATPTKQQNHSTEIFDSPEDTVIMNTSRDDEDEDWKPEKRPYNKKAGTTRPSAPRTRKPKDVIPKTTTPRVTAPKTASTRAATPRAKNPKTAAPKTTATTRRNSTIKTATPVTGRSRANSSTAGSAIIPTAAAPNPTKKPTSKKSISGESADGNWEPEVDDDALYDA